MEIFPEFQNGGLKLIDEDAMKSREGKEKWRKFIMPVSRSLPPLSQHHVVCSAKYSLRRKSQTTTSVPLFAPTPEEHTTRTTLSLSLVSSSSVSRSHGTDRD